MAEAPMITTLIPTYQRPALLERAIKSALSQTFSNLQVCVYDNASGDDTRETVQRLSNADQRVKYFCHATNIGSQKNFIYAMEHVDTPFFSFLSDDDILLPNFYKTALKGFEEYSEAIMSATVTLRMDTSGRLIGAPLHKWKPGLYQPPNGFLSMLDDIHPDWTSVVFRQDVLRKVGVLDEETGAPSDLDYMLRVAARFPIVVSNEPGAIFIEHAGGYSATPGVYTASGWSKMIRNQTEDERIPAIARAHAKTVLTKRLTQTLFLRDGIYSVVARRWNDSNQAARALRRDYGLWGLASILSAISWACEHLPLAHRSLAFVVCGVRKMIMLLKRRPLHGQFGHNAKYL